MMGLIEAVFVFGSILFSISLIPTIRDEGAYVPRKTSITTAVVLSSYALAFVAMGQAYSGATTAVTALLWWVIAAIRATAPEV